MPHTDDLTAAPIVVWFRLDLRVADNPALHEAATTGRPVIGLYVLDDISPACFDDEDWSPGGASRWWLHHSLVELHDRLAALGSTLVLRRGDAAQIVPEVAAQAGAGAVYWNRGYEPWMIARDSGIKTSLTESGLEAKSHNGSLLVEPWTIETGAGKPYTVFTPFWKNILKRGIHGDPLPVPDPLTMPQNTVASDALESFELLPVSPDWSGGFSEMWTPGETGAIARLEYFVSEILGGYNEGRDRPDQVMTSGLSPHLHFGDIGPLTVWRRVESAFGRSTKRRDDGMAFLREIAWREFSYNLLYHFPDLPHTNLKTQFDGFAWIDDPEGLAAWQKGLTGYPIVDAGMRQLWHTGWMHNRVRMIAASFLIKDLMVHWREGEAWFWDTLVDADLSSNSASWQWVAGSGADAAPFFRVFNPVTQGKKFDPDGLYVREWVPELEQVPDKYLHEPWEAPAEVLAEAGVELGVDYPEPVVAHSVARMRALAAYEAIKARKA